MEGGESNFANGANSLQKNPLNNGGQKMRCGDLRTGWWYVKLKPQNDSVLRLRSAPSKSSNMRVSFLATCRSPAPCCRSHPSTSVTASNQRNQSVRGSNTALSSAANPPNTCVLFSISRETIT